MAVVGLSLLAGAVMAPPVGAQAATFEAGECVKTPEPIAALKDARCGWLVVPENRGKAGSRTIRLPVAVIPAVTKTPGATPLVYMEGGPGGAALATAALLAEAGLHKEREVIIMGQRGTRFAQPALLCPEVDQVNGRASNLPRNAESTGRLYVEASRVCRDRFLSLGVDLGAYNTTESAADFADLRKALGIAEWNVYGVSYGTDLALTYMRQHPEGVRSVVIDSVVPPQLASVGMNWTNAGQGLGNIFAACAAEPACRSRYPDPAGMMAKLVTELEAKPLRLNLVPVLIPGQKPEPGAKPIDTLLDGAALANWLAGVSEVLGPDFPLLLEEMSKGKPDKVAASIAAAAFLKEGEISYGLQYGVVCTEWVPYEGANDVAEAGKRAFPAFPAQALAQAPQFPFAAEICKMWDVAKGPAAQRDVTTSAIPTLVVAGSYDAITSSQTAEQAAKPLPKGTFVAIPGVGHFVVPKSECAQKVMRSFLADPAAPDVTCVAGLKPPPFNIGPR
jgi:pimeloyl-ACP methyl ester carboxylesterase